MDIRFIPGAEETADERAAVDQALDVRDIVPGHQRHLLLPALHAVQRRVGWISPGALNYICKRLSVPPADAYGVASFYGLFSLSRRPPVVAHVCDDIACRVNGAEAICRVLQKRVGPPGTELEGGRATWLRSPCLGQCEAAPAALFHAAGDAPREWTLTGATSGAIIQELRDSTASRLPPPASRLSLRPSAPQTVAARASGLRLLKRVGAVDPERLDDYRAHGGYGALRRALTLGPAGVAREISDARLVGRGGAAFPTGRKWEAVMRAPVRPHYFVCNADESEPGTFKDRVLMEEDPFALIEAMTIGGYATGSEWGFLYVRGEYPLAATRLSQAIEQARARGFLGDNILGTGLCFDIELRRGAGAYICGEETALFNSIEGFRGEPRNKPPFPVDFGLFGKPTAINNVETLVNVLDILLDGGPAFAGLGTANSTGPKLFCVSGCVAKPGLYEVPFGTTLRAVIDLAGGTREGRPVGAVLLGGAAGTFVSASELDMALSLEATRAAGATIGSGVVMVFDDRVHLEDIVLRIAAFFRDESCGQCVPCRVGTVRQEEALHRLASGRCIGSAEVEASLVNDVAQAMRDASICGLGHTAASAVQSAIAKLGVFQGGRP